MAPGWLYSFVYALVAGFSELLPLSASANTLLLETLTGGSEYIAYLAFACRLGALASLLWAYYPTLRRLGRERRLARVPVRRRKRQPDAATVAEGRALRAGMVPLALLGALLGWCSRGSASIWFAALMSAVTGLALYLSQRRGIGTKEPDAVTPLDSVLVGAAAGIGLITALSPLAMGLAACQRRGYSREYTLRTAMLLAIPALLIRLAVDVLSLAAGVTALPLTMLVKCAVCVPISALAARGGLELARFLSVKAGFSAFCFYCWGLALFEFILYLII